MPLNFKIGSLDLIRHDWFLNLNIQNCELELPFYKLNTNLHHKARTIKHIALMIKPCYRDQLSINFFDMLYINP
jgi:hypothetical protein